MLDRNGPRPLYRQIKDLILGWVRSGEVTPGSRLPPERELGRRFGVSRHTVREAIAELEREGVLYRVQGSGTYVAHRRATLLRALVPEREWMIPLYEAETLYNRAHPSSPIHIEVRAVGRPRLRDELILAVAAGVAPDIALIDSVWLAELAHLKFLIPIDEAAPGWAEEFETDLLPGILQSNHHADGHLYGVQTEASASVIWYRRDLLAKVGLKGLASWADLLEAGHRLKRARRRLGISQYPIAFCGGMRGGETTTYQLLPLVWAVGEDLVVGTRPGLGAGTAAVLTDLEQLVHREGLASPQVVAFSWDEPRRLFSRGEVAIAFGGTYEKRPLQSMGKWSNREFQATVGMGMIPGREGEGASVLGGMVFTVLRQSGHPELAAEVLKLVASPELVESFCLRTGRVPSRTSVARKLNTDKHWFQREAESILARARPRPWSPYYSKLSIQFRLMVENALTQRLSPEQALTRARHGIEAVLAE
ncbi:TPA: extracellular solute-binding protein [Candidatus Bipolaricaulota bacterium]|nr:extracellular solute-binding protein [Candidatus Bipolaricaulota bacterium]